MADIAFAQNYTNLFEIDITPDGASRTWARIGAGINSVDWNGNETVAQDAYYDSEGGNETDITGGQLIGTFSGHRKYGDPAQDYIASLLLEYGSGRRTNARWTAPDGSVISGEVTVANINPQGGDPNSKSDFGFELHFDKAPVFTEGDKTTFPETITAQAVTVAVGATVEVVPTVTPSSASAAVVYGIEDDGIATVGSDGTVTGIAVGETNLSIKSAVRPMTNVTVTVAVTAS